MRCVCVFLSKKCGFHVTVLLCGWMDGGGGGNDNDRATEYSESERIHHSLTGREQSPVRGPQYNQQFLVSTEPWGRDQQISLDTQFCYRHTLYVQKENVLCVFALLYIILNQNFE